MTTALEGNEGSASRPGRSLTPGKTRYPLYRGAGWAPGPVWIGAENLAPTGIRSPDRPARSQSLKCTLVQALRFCTGRTTHKGSRGIALPFHDHGTRREWGVSVTPRPLFNPGKDPVPIVQEAVWAPGPVWIGAENFAPTGIRSPDRPARNQSLYRLSYPVNHAKIGWNYLYAFARTATIRPLLCWRQNNKRKLLEYAQIRNVFQCLERKWEIPDLVQAGWHKCQSQHPRQITAAPVISWSVGGRSSVWCWPARDSDITPFGFYLWGHLKALVNVEGRLLYIPGSSSSTRVTSSLLTPIVTAAWVCLPYLCIFRIGGHIERVLGTQNFFIISPSDSGLDEHFI